MSDMTDAEILAMFHALNEDRQLKLLDDLERLLEEQRGEPQGEERLLEEQHEEPQGEPRV